VCFAERQLKSTHFAKFHLSIHPIHPGEKRVKSNLAASWALSAGAMASNSASGAGYECGSDHDGGLHKPLLPNSGSWQRTGSRQPSLNAAGTSSRAVLRESHVSAFLCTLIVALGPIQCGFTSGYSSPTQDGIIRDLNLSISEVPPGCSFYVLTLALSSRSARRVRLKIKRTNN
jgi:MFS transporter, SP family, ERD6-like sugar transporter